MTVTPNEDGTSLPLRNPHSGYHINFWRSYLSHREGKPEVTKMYGRLWFAIGFILIVISASSALKNPGKIILDVDAGGDDAATILLALSLEEKMKNDGFEIIAITCTYGNTALKNVEQNVMKTLTIANRTDIPVYTGASKPLMKNLTLDYYFGADGLGDIDWNGEIAGSINRTKPASLALVDLARAHAGNISVMALGPLTNIAIAMALDPSFADNVKRLYVMGASVPELGNSPRHEEFNFLQDPASNYIVLTGMRGLPVILVPWETCIAPQIPMEWRKNVLGALDSRVIQFLNKVERRHFPRPRWELPDLVLGAIALRPELITRSLLTNVTPVVEGPARGSVEVDFHGRSGKDKNVIIVAAFDVEGFKQMLLETFA